MEDWESDPEWSLQTVLDLITSDADDILSHKRRKTVCRKSSDLEIHTRIVHEEYLQEKLNLIFWSQGVVSTKAK